MSQTLSSVDLSGLQKTAQAQLGAIEQGRSNLNLAVSHAETLASTWTGEASQAYQNALASFDEHGNSLLNSLSKMYDLMLNTHSQFSNAHQTTVSNAQAVNQSIAHAPAGLPGF